MGKTASTLAALPKPFLFFCRDVSNPDVKALDYVEDDPDGLRYVEDHPNKTLAIRCFNSNPNILDVCGSSKRAYCFDEIGNLFFTYSMMEQLIMFMREVGYKDGGLLVWLTSQRAAADVRPSVYRSCRTIKWVGPLYGEKDSRILYEHRSQNMDFDEFCLKLRNLKKYNWKSPNPEESILTVKDF